MRLILTRHGETIENEQGLVYGHLPGVLSARGHQQVQQLAKALRHDTIDTIYSSDLARCVDTTRPILSFHPQVPVHFLELLREQNQGSYVGKLVRDVDWVNLPPDVETPEQVCGRCQKFLDLLNRDHGSHTVLIVAHRRFNNYLINVLLKRPVDYLDSQQMMYNAALSVFVITDSGVKLESLNDFFHLSILSEADV